MAKCRESPFRTGGTRGGYGQRRDKRLLHRWVWEQVHGPIPAGMVVMHRCDNPPCFLYEHLCLGTRAENSRDMVDKGRSRTCGPGAVETCVHGHPFDDENTYRRPDRPGHRECKACRREASRRARGGV